MAGGGERADYHIGLGRLLVYHTPVPFALEIVFLICGPCAYPGSCGCWRGIMKDGDQMCEFRGN
jgi:hypothetical protein